MTVDRNLLYSRSVLAPAEVRGGSGLTGMPVAPTAMAQNFLSGNVFPTFNPRGAERRRIQGRFRRPAPAGSYPCALFLCGSALTPPDACHRGRSPPWRSARSSHRRWISLLPIPDKPPDDQHYDCRQHRADQYNCHVPLYPFPHTAFSFGVPSVSEKGFPGAGTFFRKPPDFSRFSAPRSRYRNRASRLFSDIDLGRQLGGFLIGAHQHIDHTSQQGNRRDQS